MQLSVHRPGAPFYLLPCGLGVLMVLAAVSGCTPGSSDVIVAGNSEAGRLVELPADPPAASSAPDRWAVALIRVDSQAPTILGDVASPDAGAQQSFRETQAALLQSPLVAEAALRNEDVAGIPRIAEADDPIRWLLDRIDVAFSGGGEIMEVRVSDDELSDEELTTLADTICRAYLKEVVDRERVDKFRMKEVLRGQFDRLSNELAKKRKKHADLADKLARSETSRDLLHIQYRDVLEERRMLSRKAADAALEFQLQLIDLNASPQTSALARPTAQPPPREVSQPEQPSAEASDADDEPDDDSAPVGAAESLAAAEGGGNPAAPWHRWHPAAKAFDRYQATRKGLEDQIEALEAQAARVEEQLVSQSGRSVVLSPLEDEIRRYERLVDEIGEKLLRWDVELAAPSRIRIVQNAVIQRVNGDADRPNEDDSADDSY